MTQLSNSGTARVKVWDLPTRFFHWAMLGLLAVLWWTAEAGEMDWHQIAAYSLMILILFRVIWGFIGSETSRFRHFLKSPKVALSYFSVLRSKQHHAIGHNPLGGYMVLLMMLTLCLQLTTGLFATDEVFTEGPLIAYVTEAQALQLTWLHKVNFNFLLILASVHVLAVLVHQFTGDRLVGAMFTGYKKLPNHVDESVSWSSLKVAVGLLLVLAIVIGYWLILPVVNML